MPEDHDEQPGEGPLHAAPKLSELYAGLHQHSGPEEHAGSNRPEETASDEPGGPNDEDEFFDFAEWDFPGFGVPTLLPEECLIVRPGEDFEILASLPHSFHPARALVLWRGELIAVHGRRRDVVRTPGAMALDTPDSQVATRIVLVTIHHRSRAPRTRPLRYLVITNTRGDLLGWLDHSPPSWDFQVGQVRAVCTLAHLKCETEAFESEGQFNAAHPTWTP